MESYEFLGTIGEGTYGVVIKARHKETGNLVAIKMFKESDEDEQVRKTALREIRILKKLKHDNVVSLLEVFRRNGKLYLVFEYVERTILEDLERNPNGIEPLEVKRCFYQLIKALDFIHSHNIIHRDIKPENLLISKHGVLKLCDFGFARTIARPGAKYTDYVATRWYRAPELLVGDTEYGKQVDIWASACMFAETLTGIPLFPGESDIDQLHHIMKCFGELTPRLVELFQKNPLYVGMKLPVVKSVESVRERFPGLHPLAYSILSACLKYDPEQRQSCEDLLQHPYFDDCRERFDQEQLEAIERDRLNQEREIKEWKTRRQQQHAQQHAQQQHAQQQQQQRESESPPLDDRDSPTLAPSRSPSLGQERRTSVNSDSGPPANRSMRGRFPLLNEEEKGRRRNPQLHLSNDFSYPSILRRDEKEDRKAPLHASTIKASDWLGDAFPRVAKAQAPKKRTGNYVFHRQSPKVFPVVGLKSNNPSKPKQRSHQNNTNAPHASSYSPGPGFASFSYNNNTPSNCNPTSANSHSNTLASGAPINERDYTFAKPKNKFYGRRFEFEF